MRVLVVANATVDETYDIDAMPLIGESLIGELRSRDLGGKGANVATVLARCGVPTTLVAAIGDDERGTFVSELLDRESVTLALQPVEAVQTDISIIYRNPDGDNAIVTTVATTRRLEVSRAVRVMEGFGVGDLLVLQGNLLRETTIELMDAAKRIGLGIVLNPSPLMAWIGELTGRVQSLFVNEGEARALTGASDEMAVRRLLERGSRNVILTRGPRGALLGLQTAAQQAIAGNDHHPPVPPVPIVSVPAVPATILDTTGAGDTFLAVALASAGRRNGVPDRCALMHAARAAAITVSRRGSVASFPTAIELAAILTDDPSTGEPAVVRSSG